jgi:hypothetical protein
MPTITSNTTDGYAFSGLIATWNGTHDAAGSAPNTTSTSDGLWGVRYEYVTARGAPKYFLVRAFFDFDVSGISVAPTAGTFNFKANTQNSATPLIIAKSGHDPSDTTDAWFSTWITGQGVTLSGWSASDMTKYSGDTTTNSVDSFTSFTLNADALTDMRDLSTLKICMLHSNDYNDIAPTSGTLKTGIYWANHGTASHRPYIDYTAGAAATDNATFFGANF